MLPTINRLIKPHKRCLLGCIKTSQRSLFLWNGGTLVELETLFLALSEGRVRSLGQVPTPPGESLRREGSEPVDICELFERFSEVFRWESPHRIVFRALPSAFQSTSPRTSPFTTQKMRHSSNGSSRLILHAKHAHAHTHTHTQKTTHGLTYTPKHTQTHVHTHTFGLMNKHTQKHTHTYTKDEIFV